METERIVAEVQDALSVFSMHDFEVVGSLKTKMDKEWERISTKLVDKPHRGYVDVKGTIQSCKAVRTEKKVA